MKNYLKLAFVSFLAAVNSACVEEVTIDFGDDQSNLVVHAIITDELKHQEITLSRTYPFDIKEAPAEKGALITLNTNGQSFPFEEVEEGHYRSVDTFKAEGDGAKTKCTYLCFKGGIRLSLDREFTILRSNTIRNQLFRCFLDEDNTCHFNRFTHSITNDSLKFNLGS